MNVLSWASGLAYNVVPMHKYIWRWKAEEDFECNILLKIELKKDPQLPKNVMMNGDLYIKILSDHMATMFELHQCSHFMHDSAPCHKANKVTKWLQTKKIEALEWP